jgi:hypothetical protein
MKNFKEYYDFFMTEMKDPPKELLDDNEDDNEDYELEDLGALFVDDDGSSYDISNFNEDDEYPESCDCDEDDDEELEEKVTKKWVVRNNKRIKKYVTDKKGYRITMVNGKPKEVRMKPKEMLKRKKAAKKAAKKRKPKAKQAARKRLKSLKKRR